MPGDRLIAPPSAPVLWVIVLVVSLILMCVCLWWAVFSYRRGSRPRPRSVVLSAVARTQRERWIRQIREIVDGYDPADPQGRQIHLELAAALRRMMSERSSVSVESWSVAALSQVPDFVAAAEVIAQWEKPSFAASAIADVWAARDKAIEVVRAW
ncbi:hypothetical protein [Trueperella sp. LYQ143]|uniref:hypothetical protein n=1 Tax=unclassified Trueperella TaxID=2630174 RepID=UPI003982EE08